MSELRPIAVTLPPSSSSPRPTFKTRPFVNRTSADGAVFDPKIPIKLILRSFKTSSTVAACATDERVGAVGFCTSEACTILGGAAAASKVAASSIAVGLVMGRNELTITIPTGAFAS